MKRGYEVTFLAGSEYESAISVTTPKARVSGSAPVPIIQSVVNHFWKSPKSFRDDSLLRKWTSDL